MGSFYIRLLMQTNELNATKSRASIFIVMFVLLVYIFNDFLKEEIWEMSQWIFNVKLYDISSVRYVNFSRVMSYISRSVPFTMALLIICLVDHFGQNKQQVQRRVQPHNPLESPNNVRTPNISNLGHSQYLSQD